MGELANLGSQAEVLDVGDAFTGIAQGLDLAYQPTSSAEDPPIEPFGMFTEGGDGHNAARTPMATATGYTGNNAEESLS